MRKVQSCTLYCKGGISGTSEADADTTAGPGGPHTGLEGDNVDDEKDEIIDLPEQINPVVDA